MILVLVFSPMEGKCLYLYSGSLAALHSLVVEYRW